VITDYGTLQTALANWLQRSHLIDRIPEFIQLAEVRFRRKLDDADQEASATVTITNGAGSLPADFGGLKSVNDSTIGRVEYVSPSQFADYDATEAASDPTLFTVIGTQIKTLPVSSGSLGIVYKQSLPSLSTVAPTNWLLTRAPDLYLFSALLQAELYGFNDERLPTLKSAADEILDELFVDSDRRKYGPAPLAPRIART
jgi:hypothetical protein